MGEGVWRIGAGYYYYYYLFLDTSVVLDYFYYEQIF